MAMARGAADPTTRRVTDIADFEQDLGGGGDLHGESLKMLAKTPATTKVSRSTMDR